MFRVIRVGFRRKFLLLSSLMPKAKAPSQTWLVKSEPSAYSWDNLAKDRRTAWTGVRNFTARLNLRAMQEGDPVLFYHSVEGKEVVGLAKVVRTAYADPTAKEGDWSCVDLAPVRVLKRPVTLEEIKITPLLREMKLVRQSRLSVMPVTLEEYAEILRLSGDSAKK
jgi:predicted RNA-binding protein with PUA-like domain